MGEAFGWFEQIVEPMGLTVTAPHGGRQVASGVTAGHAWTVTASRSVDVEHVADHSTVFLAPGTAAAPIDVAAIRRGVVPATIQVRRDDQVHAHFGGDEVVGLIASVFAGLRRSRKDAAITPRERVSFSSEHDRVVPLAVVDRIACWPGDAAHGGPADVVPASKQLARTPDGGLCVSVEVSPWLPLTMWTNTFGDAAQLKHAIETWELLIAALAANGAVVPRDPASIRPPTNEEVAAMSAVAGERLKQLKADRKRQR
jgi:hypothetical protein